MISIQLPGVLLISQAVAAAFASARLLQFRPRRRFIFLLLYFFVIGFVGILLSSLPQKSKTYYWIFVAAKPLAWCAAVLVVFEMFGQVFRDYPGLRTAGKWALNLALALSVTISAIVTRSPVARDSPRTRWLLYELNLDRSIYFSLALVIIFLMFVLSRYPLHLDRNMRVATGFFSAIFLAGAAVRLIDLLSSHLLPGDWLRHPVFPRLRSDVAPRGCFGPAARPGQYGG